MFVNYMIECLSIISYMGICHLAVLVDICDHSLLIFGDPV